MQDRTRACLLRTWLRSHLSSIDRPVDERLGGWKSSPTDIVSSTNRREGSEELHPTPSCGGSGRCGVGPRGSASPCDIVCRRPLLIPASHHHSTHGKRTLGVLSISYADFRSHPGVIPSTQRIRLYDVQFAGLGTQAGPNASSASNSSCVFCLSLFL